MRKKAAKPTKVEVAPVVSKVKIDPVKVKAMDPKDGETKYWGLEPLFEKQPTEHRQSALIGALNWYGRFYGRKHAKPLMVQYLTMHERKDEAKLVSKLDESEFRITLCWLARISLRGLELTQAEAETLEKDVQRLVALAKLLTEKKADKEPTATNTPNVQERMRAKAADQYRFDMAEGETGMSQSVSPIRRKQISCSDGKRN